MPRLVFVHGIGKVRPVDDSRRAWTEALAKGAAAAGHSVAAASLTTGSGVDIVFARYSDLFHTAGAQGGGNEPTEADAELVIGLLNALVEQQLAVVKDEYSRLTLTGVRDQLRPAGTAQGGGNLARLAINAAASLMEWPPLRRTGQWAGGLLLVHDLMQVSRYLNRGERTGGATLDERIRARVRAALGSGPTVVVAHSLGTVVALETLHEFGGEVPLFVTLGSPIGMRTVVWPRLRPKPPSTPDSVHRWLNFWDRDDVIVSRPQMERDLLPNSRAVVPVSSRIDSDGLWVHPVTKYLAQPAVAGPIIEALQGLKERR